MVVDRYSFILEWPFFAEKGYLSRIFCGLIAKHGPTTMSSQHGLEEVIVSQIGTNIVQHDPSRKLKVSTAT